MWIEFIHDYTIIFRRFEISCLCTSAFEFLMTRNPSSKSTYIKSIGVPSISANSAEGGCSSVARDSARQRALHRGSQGRCPTHSQSAAEGHARLAVLHGPGGSR
jgi:hypothetical protein